jgi:hypothetical protein
MDVTVLGERLRKSRAKFPHKNCGTCASWRCFYDKELYPTRRGSCVIHGLSVAEYQCPEWTLHSWYAERYTEDEIAHW